MIRIGELSQMGYLSLLVGLTVLDCQRNSKVLNRLKTDSNSRFESTPENWLHHLKQKTPIHCQERLPYTSPRNNWKEEDLEKDGKSRKSLEIKK